MRFFYDVAIVGGGPAGLAAAISAFDNGAEKVLVLEREEKLGGILNQCIHNGFGLAKFKQSLTGPEYAARYIQEIKARPIDVWTDTTVLALTQEKILTVISPSLGVAEIAAKSVILAMGCRERSRGALGVAGFRPAGVFSAGTAQKYVNMKGYLPGKRVVILGSGDIGLIMARRMTLEGAKVLAVCEIMPYSSGLRRNIVQCLNDFDIPLYLSYTIVKIEGEKRVTGVVIAEVDEDRKPMVGTEKKIDCDTVLFSVGLLPENELTKSAGIPISSKTRGAIVTQTRETEVAGIFACGNVLQVHDLVDFVSEEGEIAGKYAALNALGKTITAETVSVQAGKNVAYVCPQKITFGISSPCKIFFRPTKPIKSSTIQLKSKDKTLVSIPKKVVVPGEMERIMVPADKLEKEETLMVSIEEGV